MQVDRLERGFCYSYGMLCDSSDTNAALAFLACGGHHILLRLLSLHLQKKRKKKQHFIYYYFFFGGKDIHYTSTMIVTSRVCDVHHKPKRSHAACRTSTSSARPERPEGGVLIPCSFRLLSRRRLGLAMCCLPRCSLSVAMSVERSDIGHHTLGTL